MNLIQNFKKLNNFNKKSNFFINRIFIKGPNMILVK